MIDIKNERNYVCGSGFMEMNWLAMSRFGRVYRGFQTCFCYDEEIWILMINDIKNAVSLVFSSFEAVGHGYDRGAWFHTMYEEEFAGSMQDMDAMQDAFRKLFFDYCYDISLYGDGTGDADTILRDIIAIGSMFMTEEVLEKVLWKEEEDGKDM